MKAKEILAQVKQAIRHPFSWPGGYPVYTVMADGELMCQTCARKEYKYIAEATKDKDRSGWESNRRRNTLGRRRILCPL